MHHSTDIDETNGLPEINSFYNATKGGVDSLAKAEHAVGLVLYFIVSWI